jgi:predicted metal-dependent hydrolase
MMQVIRVGDLTFEVIRSDRRRTVEIGVERDGRLVLRAPEGVPDVRLERFATEKRMWVCEKLARKKALAPVAPRREFVSGEGFYFLGRAFRLLLVDEQDRPLKLTEGRFRLVRSEAERGREHFVAWYTECARPWLARRVDEWAPRLGIEDVGVEVLDLGFRWGSCGKGRVNFNWSTITLPPGIIDYVIIHELVHVQHAHHGSEFWSAVARAMPDHETRKQWLAEHGAGHGL